MLAVLLHPLAQAAGLTGSGPFNLGGPDDYRVPDRGYHRGRPAGTWIPTVAMVVEIVSPDDETYEKFDFYAAHGVEEILVADPARRSLAISARTRDGRFQDTPISGLLGVAAADLAASIDWPEPE